ncbi:MAG: PDZ domain-containing protein, partial [Planctomycetes bacterium]|nr:PDZ domain-containing protein [Planctomycetota bacterium]
SEGAGFAIPVTRNTRRILDTLKAGKEVHYGFLGVTVKDVPRPTSRRVADSGRFRGAQLNEITIKGGPADKAGLRPNDIIVEFDGTIVEDFDHLVRLVGFTPVGGRVPLTYLRNGERRTTSVVLGDRLEMLRKERESN